MTHALDFNAGVDFSQPYWSILNIQISSKRFLVSLPRSPPTAQGIELLTRSVMWAKIILFYMDLEIRTKEILVSNSLRSEPSLASSGKFYSLCAQIISP